MTDFEFLGRIHHLRNHCEACDALLTGQRVLGKVESSAERYAQQCIDMFTNLHSQANGFSGMPLSTAIQRDLHALQPFVIAFSLGVPSV